MGGGKRGFDTSKYIVLQRKHILARAKRFDKLYLEFGGHLCYDGHAARVLPGYDPIVKLRLLMRMKRDVGVIYCVSAKDLDTVKRLGDFKLNYEQQTLRDLSAFRRAGIKDISVVISMYKGQKGADRLSAKVSSVGYRVYVSPEVRNYLKGAKYATAGYEMFPYIPTKNKIVVVTGAAGGSGKMATAMNQVYHDIKSGINAGYAKFETFPIWNLPIDCAVNIAYEAATADLGDRLMIDQYHLKAYGKKAVNYNRDIENFSILMRIARLLTKEKHPFGYKSPTDMGINMAKDAIIDIDVCNQAALGEIRRRWKVYNEEYSLGKESMRTLKRMKEVMRKAGI